MDKSSSPTQHRLTKSSVGVASSDANELITMSFPRQVLASFDHNLVHDLAIGYEWPRKQTYIIRRKHSFRNTFQKSGCSTGRIHTSKADQSGLLCTGLPTLYGGARAYTRMEQDRTGNNRSAYGNRVGRAGLSG
ncbi:hypothetical protein GQ457_09G026360 [Hibiscus cannabinus]